MRIGFASIFACMLALLIALTPLLCACAMPPKSAAENLSPCHRKQTPQKQDVDCSHCEASEIAKRIPDSPIKPAPLELAAVLSPMVAIDIAPAAQFPRPAAISHTPQSASTLLSLHCALTV